MVPFVRPELGLADDAARICRCSMTDPDASLPRLRTKKALIRLFECRAFNCVGDTGIEPVTSSV